MTVKTVTTGHFKETTHKITWTVDQLIRTGLPESMRLPATQWLESIAAQAVEDAMNATRLTSNAINDMLADSRM